MDDEKTCSGFGVEVKDPLPPIESQSATTLALLLAQIAQNMDSMLDRGVIRENKAPGRYRQQTVLLEAARRLIERKEP